MRVNIAGSLSAWATVFRGVSHGSVLDPVRFICYIIDMPETSRH